MAEPLKQPQEGVSDDQPTISTLSNLGLPYVWIPYLILDFYGPGMTKAGWLYTMLTRIADTKTKVIVKRTVRDIATLCGCNKDTVLDWASHLKELGLIDIKPGDSSNTNVYTLLLPPFPPPPHIVEAYFPDGWTPPAYALEAAKNVRFLMTGYGRPQDVGGLRGVAEPVRNFRTIESDPPDMDNHVREKRTSNPEKPDKTSANSGQPVPENRTLINKTVKQETNEQETVFVRSLFEFFKTKSPETTYDDFEQIWFRCLNTLGDSMETAQARFQDAVGVVVQTKEPKDPEGLLWKSVEAGWKPRPTKTGPARPGQKPSGPAPTAGQDYDEQLKEQMLRAPVEQIVGHYDFVLKHDRKSDPLEAIKKVYAGNPNLEKALKLLNKGGV